VSHRASALDRSRPAHSRSTPAFVRGSSGRSPGPTWTSRRGASSGAWHRVSQGVGQPDGSWRGESAVLPLRLAGRTTKPARAGRTGLRGLRK
jgi:hypothetical protein